MNSSTLRRLAADHASLHQSELPPYFLFPPSDAGSTIQDDLTQLAILLTGPRGTPYSQGLWRLCLKLPHDYPRNPPKAFFKTRIWHPNVDENTGSVCVDTLKKDWDAKLTLRDVLITISCLLIQPNPDSALNATAGMLLQDDYTSFQRQARLMTSIHATIPPDLSNAALAARRRGEGSNVLTREDVDPWPRLEGIPVASSYTIMKKLPSRLAGTQLGSWSAAAMQTEEPLKSDMDEKLASKEDNALLPPSPVLVHIPRKSSITKIHLSNSSCSAEITLSSSEDSRSSPQNIPWNCQSQCSFTDGEAARHCSTGTASNTALQQSFAFRDTRTDEDARPAKRIRSENKENPAECARSETTGKGVFKVPFADTRKAPASNAFGGMGAKIANKRVGLRRL